MNGNGWLNLAVGVLTACALVVTGLVVRRELFSEPSASVPERFRTVEDWRLYAVDGHRFGPADAAVTIVEFADFQYGRPNSYKGWRTPWQITREERADLPASVLRLDPILLDSLLRRWQPGPEAVPVGHDVPVDPAPNRSYPLRCSSSRRSRSSW